jgi:hypothetical protein
MEGDLSMAEVGEVHTAEMRTISLIEAMTWACLRPPSN